MALVSLAELTAMEVRQLQRERTCLILTVSPIEEHGPHLPLNTDIIEADGMARRLCQRLDARHPGWTYLFYPPIPIGTGCFAYPGSADVRASAVRAVVEDIALSFAQHGFRRVILASHHGGPGHNVALDTAARTIERRSRMRALSLAGRVIVDLYFNGGLKAFYRKHDIPLYQQRELDLDCHGGAFETSEMLSLRPDLVRNGWQTLPPHIVPLHSFGYADVLQHPGHQGYFGAPAHASAALGEAYLDFVIERLLPDAERFLQGRRVPGLSIPLTALFAAAEALGRARAGLPRLSLSLEP
jgi:creatinine amidohydrolase